VTETQLIIYHNEEIPVDFFDEFLAKAKESQIPVALRSQKNEPMMVIDWLLPTAVIVYLTKPFIDDILRRASKDFGDYVYPKIKNVINTLAAKVLIGTRNRLKLVTPSGPEPREGKSAFFSLTSETVQQMQVKFVFEEGRSERDYEIQVEQALKLLSGHYFDQHRGPFLNASVARGTKTIFMLYDGQKRNWQPADVIEEIRKERAKWEENNK
jgi:hypothetical protein